MTSPGWTVGSRSGSAADLHAADLHAADLHAADLHAADLASSVGGHLASFLVPTDDALVLGSTQDLGDVDRAAAARAGVHVVRRRSGGGAVLVGRVPSTWLDLVVPRTSPLWVDDVGRAMHWVGELWAAALAELSVDVAVHTGPMRTSPWSRQVCFAGLGTGEVIDPSGRKVVGVSQRRSRELARFQTIAYHADPWIETVDLLAVDGVRRAGLLDELSSTTAVAEVAPAALRAALEAALPRVG